MVLHDQCVIICTTGLHPPIQEGFQRRDITGIPFLLKFQIGGIHVGIRIHTVEIHPFHGDGTAGTVPDLADTGIRPVAFTHKISFVAVHEYIDFHIFRQDRVLHIQQFRHEALFQIVVARNINKDTPCIFDLCGTVRDMLCDQRIFTVFIGFRSIHGQIIIPRLESVKGNFAALSFADHFFPGSVAGDLPHDPLIPIGTVIGKNDLAGFPGIIFQFDLVHIRRGLIFQHRFGKRKPVNGLTVRDHHRIHTFKTVGGDQCRIGKISFQRVIIDRIFITVNTDIIFSCGKPVQTDFVGIFCSAGIRHHIAVAVKDLQIKVTQFRFVGNGNIIIRRAVFRNFETEIVFITVAVDRKTINGLFAVQTVKMRGIALRVVVFPSVGSHFPGINICRKRIIRCSAIRTDYAHIIHPVFESGKGNLIISQIQFVKGVTICTSTVIEIISIPFMVMLIVETVAVAAIIMPPVFRAVSDQILAVGTVNIKRKIRFRIIKRNGNGIHTGAVIVQNEHEPVFIRAIGNRTIQRYRFFQFPQMITVGFIVAGFVDIHQTVFVGQIPIKFVFVYARITHHFQIIITRGKCVQGKFFVVRHAFRIIDLIPLRIIQIHIQVTLPHIKGDIDETGTASCGIQSEFEIVRITFGINGQPVKSAGCRFQHGGCF